MSELRLVLTNACNFKCFFCHGEGSKTKVENRLDADDYKFLFLLDLYLSSEPPSHIVPV